MKKLFRSLIAVLFCLTIIVGLPLTGWAENGVIQEDDVGIYSSGDENVQMNIKSSAALPLLIDKTGSSSNNDLITATIDKNRGIVNFNPVIITGHVGKFLV